MGMVEGEAEEYFWDVRRGLERGSCLVVGRGGGRRRARRMRGRGRGAVMRDVGGAGWGLGQS